MKTLIHSILISLLTFIAIPLTASDTKLNKHFDYKLVRSEHLPEEYENYHIIQISENGEKFMLQMKKGGNHYFYINSSVYGPYETIEPGNISNNGKSWGFVYKTGGTKKYIDNLNYEIMGGNNYVVVDGKTYGPFIDGDFYPRFSKNGSVWFFYFIKNNNRYLIVNGKEYGPFSIEFYESSGVITDCKSNWRFMYLKNDKWYLLNNGNESGPYEDILGFYDEKTPLEKLIFVINNKPRHIRIGNKEYDQVEIEKIEKEYRTKNKKILEVIDRITKNYILNSFDTTLDGKSWVTGYFNVSSDNQEQWYISTPFKTIGPLKMEVSHNIYKNKINIGYTFNIDDKVFISVNNKRFGPFDYSSKIHFEGNNWYAETGDLSGNNTYHNLIIKNNGMEKIIKKFYNVINGDKYGPYDEINPPCFTENNDFGFCARKNSKSYAVTNGKEFGPYEIAEIAADGHNFSIVTIESEKINSYRTFFKEESIDF